MTHQLPRYFDVLIVYSESLSRSASDPSPRLTTPFSLNSRNASYNTVYGYFLEVCTALKLKAAFTTSVDIIGAGSCKSFWLYKNKAWLKINSPCFCPLIFDKFSPTKNRTKLRRNLLFSSPKIKPFNDPDLFNLFFDKQKTYDKLSDYSIPTTSLADNTLASLNNACNTLTKLMYCHPGFNDFSSDLVMKDRFGAGGRHVYKFKTGQAKNMLAVIRKNTHISFIIQPFARFDQGFSYHNCPSSADIRLIYLKGKIVQSYIRVAKPDEFRCNEHQGGSLTYLSLKEIPPSLIARADLISKTLNKNCSLFALDFIISNNGNTYLLEGNTGPGLDWNISLIKNETEAKKLIRLVVKELATRVQPLIS